MSSDAPSDQGEAEPPSDALPSDEAFQEALLIALEDGRTLLKTSGSQVAHESPSLIAATCRSVAVDEAVRKVTLFAFVLSVALLGLVLVRAVPRPMAAIVLVWISVALLARLAAKKRRRELGDTLISLDSGAVLFRPQDRPLLRLDLRGATLTTEAAVEGDELLWLVLRYEKGRVIRIGRGPARDVDRILTLFRQHKLPVLAPHRAVA